MIKIKNKPTHFNKVVKSEHAKGILMFHELAEKYVNNDNVKVNKINDFSFNDNDKELSVNLEYVKEKKYDINDEALHHYGELMARMHNFAYKFKWVFTDLLPVRIHSSEFDDWEKINNTKNYFDNEKLENIFNEGYTIRKNHLDYFDKPFAFNTMVLPVHRDFSPKNILFDGKHYTLIDFEFCAYANIEIEIGRFLLYLTINNIQVKTFVDSYYKNLNNNIKNKQSTKNIINLTGLYLISNTFPYYSDRSIDEKLHIAERRNKELNAIINLKNKLI